MGFFDVFAWVVLLLLVSMGMGVIVFLGIWPGKVARARNHPQAEAIAIGSWLTLLLGFVFWPIVVIWAHMRPTEAAGGDGNDDRDDLAARLSALEERITFLETDTRQSKM